jgi:drug/metabolite transporter (DMT)-like permease
MFSYIWPMALVILANTFYQICTKSAPAEIDPFAFLITTYLTAAGVSAVLYFALNRGGSLAKEFTHLNWTAFALGAAIVALEVGFIYAYKNGWAVSTAAVVQGAFLAVTLLFVGLLLYHETITASKIAGIVICLVGLYFINR